MKGTKETRGDMGRHKETLTETWDFLGDILGDMHFDVSSCLPVSSFNVSMSPSMSPCLFMSPSRSPCLFVSPFVSSCLPVSSCLLLDVSPCLLLSLIHVLLSFQTPLCRQIPFNSQSSGGRGTGPPKIASGKRQVSVR